MSKRIEEFTLTVPQREDLEVLLSHDVETPVVSIYVPIDRHEPPNGKAVIRLKTLLNDAREQLDHLELRAAQRDELLEPATALIKDPKVWQQKGDGLALFLAAGQSHRFHLPISVPERAIVGERFHLLPLAELYLAERHLLVLALSQHSVRLFEADQWSISEIPVPDLPEDSDETTPDNEQRDALQLRQAAAGPGNAAFFHGHGGTKDTTDINRERFLRAVDRALRPVLARRDTPMIVAGVDELVADFRALSHSAQVYGEIPGAPDKASPSELHAAAWQVFSPRIAGEREAALDRYRQAAGTGLASAELGDITRAANEGRVDVLLLPSPTTSAPIEHTDQALLDDAMIGTLRNSGSIHVVLDDEAAGSPLPAAVFRY